jgi:hypothetical protein
MTAVKSAEAYTSVEKPDGKRPLGNTGVNERTMLQSVFEEKVVRGQTG